MKFSHGAEYSTGMEVPISTESGAGATLIRLSLTHEITFRAKEAKMMIIMGYLARYLTAADRLSGPVIGSPAGLGKLSLRLSGT